ncbi:MAG: M15 family metallopeptidase [Oscillospiraceae bacterium]|nr:M15 family metallopeptidase [Oscillospiraceae bacterium]
MSVKNNLCGYITVFAAAAMFLISTTGCTPLEKPDTDQSSFSSASDISAVSEEEKENVTSDKNYSLPADKPDGTESEWQIRLVNINNPLPESYKPETVSFPNNAQQGVSVDVRMKDALDDMIAAAQKDGTGLYVYSAYRSFQRQTELFDNSVGQLMQQGKTKADAESETAKNIAVPGTSEHQYGLAADIVNADFFVTNPSGVLDVSFDETQASKWLRSNAHKYGFILRYPKDKTGITKINYEPWHYRYVGKEHAANIKNLGITLEEYVK